MADLRKKTLIVSSYAPPSIGGAQIIIYNLFRDFPADSYSILTSFYNIDNFAAKNGRWLSGKYFFYDDQKATRETSREVNNVIANRKTLAQSLKLMAKRILWLKSLLIVPAILIQLVMVFKSGLRAVKESEAEIILSLSDYGPAIIGGYFIHKITKKPLIVFMFDLYKGNYLPVFGGFLSVISEPLIFKSATKIIVTNDGTKEFYEKEYGVKTSKKIEVIYNGTLPDDHKLPVESERTKTPYTIIFTGQIYWPQLGSLRNLIQAIKNIDDLDINLNIYSPNSKDYLEKLGIVESSKIKIDVAAPDKIATIQAEADILFLPLSWHTKGPQIIDTATPGKLTDYLITGKPILIHAPASTYLVKYAKKNNFAAVVDEEDIDRLKKTIINLIKDTNLRKELVKNARETFFKNHDVRKNAIRLANIISSI